MATVFPALDRDGFIHFSPEQRALLNKFRSEQPEIRHIVESAEGSDRDTVKVARSALVNLQRGSSWDLGKPWPHASQRAEAQAALALVQEALRTRRRIGERGHAGGHTSGRPPCECGSLDAGWHGDEHGLRTYSCDACYRRMVHGSPKRKPLVYTPPKSRKPLVYTPPKSRKPLVYEPPRGQAAGKKPRKTPDQVRALAAYNQALLAEDKYLGSVFVTPQGQKRVEERTRAAYEACKRLGMGPEHGLAVGTRKVTGGSVFDKNQHRAAKVVARMPKALAEVFAPDREHTFADVNVEARKAAVGQRVQLHPATDRWMMGDRYGVIVKYDPVTASRREERFWILLDRSGQRRRFHPSNVLLPNRPR